MVLQLISAGGSYHFSLFLVALKRYLSWMLAHFKSCLFSLIVFVLFLTSSFVARAAEPQVFIYDVYAGGIHAVEATLNIDLSQKGAYTLALKAQTRGFLGSLAPWSGVFESQGWVEKDGLYRPQLHRSTAVWKGEEEIKSYHYGRDGSFKGLEIKDHDQPLQKKDVDDALTQGTTDALTATLSVMHAVAAGKKCAGEEEVFDGKRRFKQVFNSEGQVVLPSSRYNAYQGDAVMCAVEVVPVAGAWHKKPRGWMSIQEQGRERGTMPTIWMGMIEDKSVAIPVKIRVKTAFGTLFMHLTEYHDGQTLVKADKRK